MVEVQKTMEVVVVGLYVGCVIKRGKLFELDQMFPPVLSFFLFGHVIILLVLMHRIEDKGLYHSVIINGFSFCRRHSSEDNLPRLLLLSVFTYSLYSSVHHHLTSMQLRPQLQNYTYDWQ